MKEFVWPTAMAIWFLCTQRRVFVSVDSSFSTQFGLGSVFRPYLCMPPMFAFEKWLVGML
jgi:hypothetical protein